MFIVLLIAVVLVAVAVSAWFGFRRYRDLRAVQAREARLLREQGRMMPRVLSYRAQRGLSPEMGSLADLTPRQQRRVKHKFTHPEGVELEEVFDA